MMEPDVLEAGVLDADKVPLEENGGSASGAAARAGAPSSERFQILDGAYDEFCRLEEQGRVVDAEAFCARYPQVQSSLAKLVRAHHFLAEQLESVPEEGDRDWPAPGQTIGGFTLIRELGRGSYSRVFQATEKALGGRLVALKISTMGGEAEAATIGPLEHDGVVSAYSATQDKATGLWAICMPYRGSATLHHVLDHLNPIRFSGERLTGRHLLDACRDPYDSRTAEVPDDAELRAASFSDALRGLAIRLADALAFIHARGIQHRDLKPSNILLCTDGAPLLLDFNLSADARHPQERLGGTPLYMAPEQLEATSHRSGPPIALDHRADLFSLGALLYELATGAHPFGPVPFKIAARDLRALLIERHEQGPEPVRKRCPDLDTDLAAAIDACLSRDPSLRPSSALDLRTRLARPSPWPRRAARFFKNRPRTALVSLLSIAALGGLLALPMREPATNDLVRIGQEAFRQDNFDQAKHFLNQVLQRDPEHFEALMLRGQTYARLNDLHSANADFHTADQIKPDGLAKAWRGYCFQRLKQPGGARPAYESAREKGVASVALLNNLGTIYLDAGELDRAQEVLQKAVELNPNVQAVQHNLALLCLRLGLEKPLKAEASFREGIQYADRALMLGKDSTELLFDCAVLHALAARKDRELAKPAIDYLRKAIGKGHDTGRLAKSASLSAIRAEVQELLGESHTVAAVASKADRLLEPTTD